MWHKVFNSAVIIGSLLAAQVLQAQCQGDSWRKRADMPRIGIGMATCEVDGKLYVFGAGWASNSPLNATYEYDPANNRWTRRADMPTERTGLLPVRSTASAMSSVGAGACRVML